MSFVRLYGPIIATGRHFTVSHDVQTVLSVTTSIQSYAGATAVPNIVYRNSTQGVMPGQLVFEWTNHTPGAVAAITVAVTASAGAGGSGSDAFLNILDYGGVPNSPGANNTTALHAAIRALSATRGGTVIIPFGDWYFTESVFMSHSVHVRGVGVADADYGGTRLFFPAGVTAFKFPSNATDYSPGEGAHNAELSHCTIIASARNTNTGTAAVTNGSQTVTLSAAGDFQNRQVVRIEGAGDTSYNVKYQGIIGASSNGTNRITLTYKDSVGGFPFLVGMYVKVSSAAAGTIFDDRRITAINVGSNYFDVDGAAAGSTASNLDIEIIPDYWGEIRSGGGTTTLTMDWQATRTLSNRTIHHADAGVHCRSHGVYLHDLSIHDFAGNAIHVQASVSAPIYGNANLTYVERVNTRLKQGGVGNQNGMFFHGGDSNAGDIKDSDVGGSLRGFGILDLSFLGNNYVGIHTDGPRGFASANVNANQSVFTGCYAEGGSYVAFGLGTTSVGGTMPRHTGGGTVNSFNGLARLNRMLVGSAAANADAYEVSIVENATSLMYWKHTTGEIVYWRKGSSSAGDGAQADGWWGTFNNNDPTKCAFLISNSDSDIGASGHLWVPHRLYIGAASNGTLTNSLRVRIESGTAAPVAGAYLQGDRVLNKQPTVAGGAGSQYTIIGWICTVSGSPGTWVEMRALTGT